MGVWIAIRGTSRSTSRKGQHLNEHAFCSQSLLPDLLSPMLERGSPRYDFINFSDFGEGWQRDTLVDASFLWLQCLSIVFFTTSLRLEWHSETLTLRRN